MKLLLAVIPCSLLVACSSTDDGHEPPPLATASEVVQSRCHFSFRAPADVVAVDVEGIDTCVDQFRSKSYTYYVNYGWYGDPLEPVADRDEYEAQEISVDGAPATLVQFRTDAEDRPYFVGILMENVDPESPEVTLSFDAWCGTAQARDAAIEVVRSVMRDG